MKKLVQEAFLKNQNWTYLKISSLNLYAVCFYCMAKSCLPWNIKTKVLTTCFYLIESFIKNEGATLFSIWFLKENAPHVKF